MVTVCERSWLPGLGPVVEAEGERAEVFVDDVAQVVLHVVRRAQKAEPGTVGERAPDDRERGDPDHVAVQAAASAGAVREVDGLPEQVRDLHLDDKAQKAQQERQAEHPFVREHDGQYPLQPAVSGGRPDHRPRRLGTQQPASSYFR